MRGGSRHGSFSWVLVAAWDCFLFSFDFFLDVLHDFSAFFILISQTRWIGFFFDLFFSFK